MSATITIRCDTPGCFVNDSRPGRGVTDVRSALRAEGWSTSQLRRQGLPRVTYQDLCPSCTQGTKTGPLLDGRIPYERCALEARCPSRNTSDPRYHPEAVGVYDWWGHDPLGHRAGRLMVRHGWFPLDVMLALPLSRFLDTMGFGTSAAQRWEHFTKQKDTPHA
ncbi:MAG TPA: hypothetical protein VIM84_11065 [Gemmatimonadales bacterium]